jgi:hypothetical protein
MHMQSIRAYVIHHDTVKAEGANVTSLRSALVTGAKEVSALPFCPIASGNAIKVNAYLHALHVPQWDGMLLQAKGAADKFKALAGFSSAAKDGRLKLGLTISKSKPKSHLYVAIGDSSLDGYNGL